MRSIGYNIPIQPKPKRKTRLSKIFIIALTVSLFFLQQSPATPQAVASNHKIIPDQNLLTTNTYLSIKNDSPSPRVFSKSYLLMNAANGDVLTGKNQSHSLPVASTTKMVTALVAVEEFELNEVVEVQKLAATINGSDIDLVIGEKITVRDLLKGLLIQSGNDAAFALAEHYSQEPGNYQLFVDKMNKFVKDIGLNNTVFGDPAGLDDENGRSTAWDLAHIARLLLQNKSLKEMVATPRTTIASIDGRYTHELENSNRLIKNDSSYYMNGVIGIKTGFTPEAGHCLVSAYKLGDKELIGVVLNTNEFTVTASASETRKLYSWADRYVKESSY